MVQKNGTRERKQEPFVMLLYCKIKTSHYSELLFTAKTFLQIGLCMTFTLRGVQEVLTKLDLN